MLLESGLRWALKCAFVAVVSCVFASEAWAIPRFAARQGTNCSLCHVNPTGGGQRNTYGKQVFAKFQLPANPGDPEKTSNLKTEWIEGDSSLAIGMDFRGSIISTFPRQIIDESGDEATSFQLPAIQSAFLMQDDIYLTLGVTKDFLMYVDYGVASGNLEAFALKSFGSKGGYIKVGQFLPAYGLKLPNHRTYIREEGLGLEPNLREAGIELGISPGKHNVYISVINGTALVGGLNPDWKPAVTGRMDVNTGLGPVKLTLGASGWYEPGGTVDLENGTEFDRRTLDLRAGPYLMMNAGKVTVLVEADYRRTRDNGADTLNTSYVTYTELDIAAKQGLDLQLFHEVFDPEITITPNLMHRAGAGFEFFPTGFSEFRVLYRHTFVPMAEEAAQDPRTLFSAANQNMDEVVLFAHFFL